MAGNSGPNIVEDGLIFAVDAANKKSYPGSGTAWNDLIGDNNGTLVNSPTYSTSNLGSLQFTTDDYATFADNTVLDISSNFSISIWFKPTNNHGDFCGIFNKDSAGNFGNWGMYGDGNSNYVRFGFRNTSSVQQETSNSSYTDLTTYNVWYNYQGVFDSSETRLSLYRNGVIISNNTSVAGTPLTNNNPAVVAIRNTGTQYRFNGYVGPCMLYNRTLSPEEITQNYNALKSRFGL